MSERAKIHLGDIQCECLKRSMDCEKGGVVCDYRPICHAIKNEMPLVWDLRDPPRFNEAQMAFWRGLHAIGINFVMLADDGLLLRMAESRQADNCTMIAVLIEIKLGLSKGEELDLAELFGKDGADEKT